LEKMREFGISIHLHFIDFESAYDSIDREQIYVDMNELNILQKLIKLVKVILSNSQSQIKIQSKLSSTFISHKGVLHALARLLFNIKLEYAIRKSDIQTRGTIFYELVQVMTYANDIVIIGRSLASMRKGFQLPEEASKEVGLVNYEGKTKYMISANTQNCSKPRAIEIGRSTFE